METKGKVLIVDDDPVVRHILSTVIKNGNYEPICAERGEECLSLLREWKEAQTLPIAVFLDFFLDDMSGEDVLKIIRSEFQGENLPVIIISAKSRDEMLTDSSVTPDYYLEKPFKSEVVLSLLQSAHKAKL